MDWTTWDKFLDEKHWDLLNELSQLWTVTNQKQNRWSNLETCILKNSKIVCATLSMAGIEKVF